MDVDFSVINHMYLSKAREISREDPAIASAVLGLPIELITILSGMPLEDMSQLITLKPALVTLRLDAEWWETLFFAAHHGSREAVEASICHGLLQVFS